MIRAWLERWLCGLLRARIDMCEREIELLRKAHADQIAINTKQLADLRLTIAAQREEARKPAGVARSFREIQSFIGETDA